MFSKIVGLCAFVTVAQAGLLVAPVAHYSSAAPARYSSAASVSSQSIVRHDELAPTARLAVAAPLAYLATPAPLAYRTAPVPLAYTAAPAALTYRTAPASLAYRAPVASALAPREDQEFAYPKYEYNYSVADGQTGDNKSQQEIRDGDVVRGSYSFHEADGSIRTVEYSADDHNGFNAVVQNSAPSAAPAHVVSAVPIASYYPH